jgi:hypothetical protein
MSDFSIYPSKEIIENNSSILIVGNGTSLLNEEYGEKINSYTKVVRFNNYGTRDFEKYAGSKTNIWFNVINFLDKENEWRMNQNYDKVFVHSWEPDPQKDKLFLNFKEYYKNKSENFLEKIPHTIIQEIVNYSKDPSYTGISTGLIAIWFLLKFHQSVDIIGFDWWDTEKHHYNDNAIRGNLHKPQKEKEIINNLYKEGKLCFLS